MNSNIFFEPHVYLVRLLEVLGFTLVSYEVLETFGYLSESSATLIVSCTLDN